MKKLIKDISQLKGYILEEVVAYLIKKSGYRLIISQEHDPEALQTRGDTLYVNGRGAIHQADVLGEMNWIPAFTYPLRLFVEAKYRIKPTQLKVVRNAVGTIHDINQYKNRLDINTNLHQLYQYSYALFSTTGFTEEAYVYGLAHNVFLIELRDDQFSELKDAISKGAKIIVDLINKRELSKSHYIKNLRRVLRKELNPTQNIYPGEEYSMKQYNLFQESVRDNVIKVTQEFGCLFTGMTAGPHMIILIEEDDEDKQLTSLEESRFLRYAKEKPFHKIKITWSTARNRGRLWEITPIEGDDKYKLTFILPKVISDYVFSKKELELRKRALDTKEKIFSRISIYYNENGEEYAFLLKFDLEGTIKYIEENYE